MNPMTKLVSRKKTLKVDKEMLSPSVPKSKGTRASGNKNSMERLTKEGDSPV